MYSEVIMRAKNIFTLLILIFTLFFTLQAQSKEEKKAQKETKKLEREQVEKVLDVYKSDKCSFSNLKLKIIKIDRMAKNEEEQTLVRHTAEGVKGVSRTDSYRIIFAQETDKYLFANLRFDRSRPYSYNDDKKFSIESLEKINNDGKNMDSPKLLEKQYNGFAAYSANRSDIVGNTVGVTMIFDDKNKIIVTVYFINKPPNVKSEFILFNSIQEWKVLQDKFLDSYTKCVADNLK
jgi:hypothetical protein